MSLLILDALTDPEPGATQNYFALVFADQSAATVADVLQDCRSDPGLARLSVAYRGLAATEDRPGGSRGLRSPVDDGIVVAAQGKWTIRTLSEEIVRYADYLFRHFATTHERGITKDELAEVRDRLQATGPAPALPALEPDDTETDLLAVVSVPPAPDEPDRVARPAPLAPAPEPAPYPERPLYSEPAPDPEPAPLAQQSPGAASRAWPRLPRWRLTPPRPKAVDAGEDPGGQPAEVAAVETGPPTLVFMLLHGDTNVDERSSWRRGRSLMAEVDRGLAAARPCAFKVRAFSGRGGSVKTLLREAGSLSSRDIKRPDPSHELAPSLRRMHSVLQKDLNANGQAGDPEILPVIVIFAIEIPVADVITADAYIALALDTSIIWVVPEGGSVLLSQTFSTSESHIIVDHDEVAAEVVDSLLRSARPQDAHGGQGTATGPGPRPAAFVITHRGQPPGQPGMEAADGPLQCPE